MPTEPDEPDVSMAGLLRAVRAQAAYQQRMSVRDLLIGAALNAEGKAGAAVLQGDQRTKEGRRAAGLRLAVELIDAETAAPTPGEFWCQIVDMDGVTLYSYDPFPYPPANEGGPEGWPVRLVAEDSAAPTVACAYLSLVDARDLARELNALCDKIDADRAARGADTPDPATLSPVQSGE